MKINNLILELNDDCNSNCHYCYLESRVGHDDSSDSYFIEKLKEHANEGILNVDFTGGEATIARHFLKLVKFTKFLGYPNRTLITNGRRLQDADYLQKVIDVGINRFVISIDGPNAKVADAITRTPGSFEQTRKGMKNVSDSGLEWGATMVLTAQNYLFALECVEQMVALGVHFFNFQFMLPHVESESVKSRKLDSYILPKYEEVVPIVKECIDQFKDQVKINVHFLPFCYFEGYESFLKDEASKLDRLAYNYRKYGYVIGEHLRKGCVKIDQCIECPHNKNCIGFSKFYAQELGIKELVGNPHLKIEH